MDEETVYDGYIERHADGSYLAFLGDLLGCSTRARGESEALAALTTAIPTFYDWLRTHDEYTPQVHGPYRVLTAASVEVPSGHWGGFYPMDSEPVSQDDLDWNVAILDWSYDDLSRLIGSSSQDEILRGLVRSQPWLISRIESHPAVPPADQLPGTPADHLRQVWKASVARLRGASDEDRARVLEHGGERWSLRKVLRCSILSVRNALGALTT